MKILCCCVLLLGVVGLTACAGRPMTDSDFRGFCYGAYGRRTSCDTIPICTEFETALSQEFAGRNACVAACSSLYDRLYAKSIYERCLTSLGQINRLCIQYCNSHYSE